MTDKTVARPLTSNKTAPVAKRTRSIVLGDPDVDLLRVDLVRPGRVLTMTLDVAAETVALSIGDAEGEKHFRAYDVVTEWSGPPRATVEEAERDAEEHNEGCARQGGYGSAVVAERDEGDRLWNAYTGETIWPPHGRSNGAARWR
jgi:hypothetical protein